MRALIDGDIIAHSVAAACEGTHYLVQIDADTFVTFKYKKEANEFCSNENLDRSMIHLAKNPEPLPNCLHSVKLMVQGILRDIGATRWTIYLTGSNNFRKNVCPDYKAHRPEEKPTHLEAVREYLIDTWGAIVTDGIEADDALGIEHTNSPDETVICTTDKDLNTIPGLHYNWRHNREYTVTPEEANKNFWVQMLTGDASDNIFGIKGVGDVKARKALDNLCAEEYECYVGLAYAIHFDDPEVMFKKNRTLLTILTK